MGWAVGDAERPVSQGPDLSRELHQVLSCASRSRYQRRRRQGEACSGQEAFGRRLTLNCPWGSNWLRNEMLPVAGVAATGMQESGARVAGWSPS